MRAYVWAKPRKDPYKHRVNGRGRICPSILVWGYPIRNRGACGVSCHINKSAFQRRKIEDYKLAPLFILLLFSGNKKCYRTHLGHPSSFTWTIKSRNVNSAKRVGESKFTRVGARRKIDLIRLWIKRQQIGHLKAAERSRLCLGLRSESIKVWSDCGLFGALSKKTYPIYLIRVHWIETKSCLLKFQCSSFFDSLSSSWWDSTSQSSSKSLWRGSQAAVKVIERGGRKTAYNAFQEGDSANS